MQAWEDAKTSRQKQEVVYGVAKVLQTISQAEAQALSDKDPDVVDRPSFSLSSLRSCLGR